MNKTLAQISAKMQMTLVKIQSLPSIIAGKQWYTRQSQRDQIIIKAVLGFVATCFIIILFIQPFYSKQASYQSKLNKSIVTYEKLASNSHKFRGKNSSSNSTPILALITQQAKIANINLKRFEPDDQNLRIWLDNASFDDTARWLETLTRDHGIKVKQISIDRSEKNGRVDLRATLYK